MTAAPELVSRPRPIRPIGCAGRDVGTVTAIVYLAVVLLAALAPGLLATHDPYTIDPANAFQPPSAEHVFGTDSVGRDVYSRVVHGTQLSLAIAAFSVAVGLVISALLGVVAGFAGGRVDNVIMRAIDVLLAIPGILIALMLVSTIGFGLVNLGLAVAIGSVAGFSRLIRSEVFRVRTGAFVEASYISGGRWTQVLRRHVLPHSLGPVLALLAVELGSAILSISALSYLGFGAAPPTPEWGTLLSESRDYMSTGWWLVIIPSLVITLTVLSINRIGRAIEDRTALR